MRPRKRIAVVGATETEASLLSLVLDVRGYRVEICLSENAAMRIETPDAFLILGLSQSQRQRVESRLRLEHRGAGCVMDSHGASSAAWMQGVLAALATATAKGSRRGAKHGAAKRSAAGDAARAQRYRRTVA